MSGIRRLWLAHCYPRAHARCRSVAASTRCSGVRRWWGSSRLAAPSRILWASLRRTSTTAASLREGGHHRAAGVFPLALDKGVGTRAMRIRIAVHMAGRAMTPSVLLHSWTHHMLMRVASTSRLSTRRRRFKQIVDFHAALQGLKFMMGACIVVHPGGSRHTRADEERRDADQLAVVLGKAFSGYIELHIPAGVHFQEIGTRDADKSMFSRMARSYTSLHPLALWSVVGVVGGVLDARHPSDHRVVKAIASRAPTSQTPHASAA